jgi:hypothetical protein
MGGVEVHRYSFFNFCSRRRRTVSFTRRPLYPRSNSSQYPLNLYKHHTESYILQQSVLCSLSSNVLDKYNRPAVTVCNPCRTQGHTRRSVYSVHVHINSVCSVRMHTVQLLPFVLPDHRSQRQNLEWY